MRFIALLVIAAAAVRALDNDDEPVVLPEGMLVTADDVTMLEEMLVPDMTEQPAPQASITMNESLSADPTEHVSQTSMTESPLSHERRGLSLEDFMRQRFDKFFHKPNAKQDDEVADNIARRALDDYVSTQREKQSSSAGPSEPSEDSELDKRDLERRELDRRIDKFVKMRWDLPPSVIDEIEAEAKGRKREAPVEAKALNLVRRVEDFVLRRLGMPHHGVGGNKPAHQGPREPGKS